MECHRALCALLLLAATATAHFIRSSKNSSITSQGSCFYNGTWFADGEELPTRGLCLICHCFEGFREPNAFSCNVIDCPWEDYHRRFPGCTPIYADRDCCPIGWECDYGTGQSQELIKVGCNCEWRYLKHYEAKGCRPVYEEKPREKCACPWRFDCSQTNDVEPDDKVCMYKKHIYPVGSRIPTSNACETCSCGTDYFTQAATIQCTTIECPSIYSQTPLPKGCHYVYKEDQCCPTSVECPTSEQQSIYKVPSCEYKGKMYYEGEQIYPDEDPCLTCLCDHKWTGVSGVNSSCRQHDCMLERDSRKLKQGCIPIYHEKTCCPIDYHCSDGEEEFKLNKAPSFKLDDDEDEMCFFESRYYPIGHVLDIKHPTNCVTCTCKTPPDFTCIHSSCPPPPNNDYTNCKAIYKPHSCCPDYTCEEKNAGIEKSKEENDPRQQLIQKCKEMECPAHQRCMLVEKECSGENCLPVAQCEKVSFGCGQESCPEGCEVIGNYEDNCPICSCKGQEDQYKLTCRVQSCEENCILSGRDENGCPVCKCPQGNLEERICAPSKCTGYNCTMTVDSLGCAACTCQLSCKPRECPVGCDLDMDISANSGLECGCTCKNSSTAVAYLQSKAVPETCQPHWCQGLNCSVFDDKSGCPVCSCRDTCPVPVCQEGCKVEVEVSEPGRCPGCICKLSRSARDNTVKECPPPTCQGYNCSVITEENGCQKCSCESPCEDAPQCPSHCKLETNVPQGRCRGCVCSYGEHTTDATTKTETVDDMELEKREDIEADFIPLPGKEVVPGVDNIFLVHGEDETGEYAGMPGYHYQSGHAYPVFGEPLESALYNVDDVIPGELESGVVREDEDADYIPEMAEEKALDEPDDKGKCAQKNCPEGQKCVIRRLQCIRTPCPTIPVCIDVEPRCPIPMCAIGCMVMKWDDEVCPSCFCGIIRGAEGRVCPRTRCAGRRCYNVIGDDGCPQCKCDSICIPPKCGDGCRVEENQPSGKCPTCVCGDRSTVLQPIIPASPTADAYAAASKYSTRSPAFQCPTPHCNGYNCSLIRGADGCQKCVCDSPCAPCPKHCVKTKTYSEGRCPVCDCTQNSGPSPSCPPVSCIGKHCTEMKGPNGCPVCSCCNSPKCRPGCSLQTGLPPGVCPTCVCPTFTDDDDDEDEDDLYCPNLFCSEYGCREIPGPAGCPICSCDQPVNTCRTPICDAGCEVVSNKYLGKCPVCICSHPNNASFESSSSDVQVPISESVKTATNTSSPIFTGIVQPVVAEEDESTMSTLHTTVTVDLEDIDETVTVPETTTTEAPTTQCPAPICSGLRCGMEIADNGCEVCKCRYKCPTPKCVGSCYAEVNAPSHRCPGCVCPSKPKPPRY